MAIHHPSTTGDPVSYTPTQIFQEYLPKILELQADMAKQVGGVVNVKINGEGGGEWTIDVAKRAVSPGQAKNADLSLTMDTQSFKGIISGKLDPNQALESEKVKVDGRPQLLVGLAALLRPAD